MRRCAALWAFGAMAALAGCAGVEPLPLRGPRPHSILVVPPVDAQGQLRPAAGMRIARLCGAELRGLGYRVATPERWWSTVDAAGLIPEGEPVPADLAELGRLAHVDAVLTVHVHRWDVLGADVVERLDYDFDYELWSTALGMRQWNHRVSGVYERPASIVGAHEFDLADDGPATMRVSGGGGTAFRGVDGALAEVQRWAMARLPARP